MFNYNYEIASLLFLGIVAWRFTKFRQFPLLSNRVFGIILFFATADILCDIASIVTMRPEFPVCVSFTFNTLYYILQLLIPCALIVYMLALLSNTRKITSMHYIKAMLPSFIFTAVMLIGLPMGYVFSISPDYVYSRGPLSGITYVGFSVNILISLVLLYYFRKEIPAAVRNSYIFLTVISVVCVFIQYLNHSLLVTSIGLTASITIMYFNIQDPNRMLDSTTDAFNHSAFRIFLDSCINGNKHINIASFHINDLRRANTLYGNKNTDRLLKNYSQFLSSRNNPWVFRLSGARFVIITGSDDEIDRISQYPAVFSITTDTGSLLTVDISRYIIKSAEKLNTNILLNIIESTSIISGSNNDRFFEINEKTVKQVERKIRIESILKDSVETGTGFSMNYQPLYSAEKERFVSAESLLRFFHPELGTIHPDEFIPVAEAKGLAPRLDEMVIGLVFKEISAGTFDALDFDYVQINLSVESFANENIISYIRQMLRKYSVSPDFIVFEITETATSCSSDVIRSKMLMLRKMGFRFAMDDFGTGYSSIARQLTLPFSIVKLDKSLLSSSRDIFSELVRVLSRLGVTIIAEGVENEEEAEFVKDTGVRILQGYYYSCPVPADSLRQSVEKTPDR